MKKMIRLLAAILFTCCLTAQLNAQASSQPSQDQSSKDQPTKDQPAQDQPSKDQALTEPEPAAPTAVVPIASTQFPLDAFREFSAVMVGSVMPGDDRESHIYRSGNLVRTEGLEGHNFLITNLATLETFGVSALACMHDSNPFFRSAPFSSMKPGYKVERADSGHETVDGHSCKIEDVTLSSPKLPRPIKLRLWEAEDLQGFPVKVEFMRPSKHNPIISYKNVVLGPQDPTLFIYPRTCEPLGFSKKPGSKPGSKTAPGAKKPAVAAPAGTPQS
jgi:hypothetical protein